MSNYLAIATVTATLQRILQVAVQERVYGARVTTVRPDTIESGSTQTCVNIYMYMATPNSVLPNTDAFPRRPRGELGKRTQVALDLQYLLSFHGKETELEPQRLLGCVVNTLQDALVITSEMIRDTLADPTFTFLAEADLTDQVEPIFITPTEISVENLSKIWSTFMQTPYSLSATYKGSIVFIEGQEPGARALPVRERRSSIMPFSQILVERVVPRKGALEPIVADSTLLILGRNLYHANAMIRIGGLEMTPETMTNSQITFSLASVPGEVLRAGIQSLRIVHPLSRLDSDAAAPYQGVESNLATFVLRPTITSVEISNVQDQGDNTRTADVTVQFNLTIEPKQLVVLILNEWSVDRQTSYVFKATARQVQVTEASISLKGVRSGEYLVRVQVDGAESLLNCDTDRNSPTFNWYIAPKVSII